KAGGDGVQGLTFLKGVGFPAAEGWYSTNASPHVTEDPATGEWAKRYKAKFNNAPFNDYTVTAYNAGLLVIAPVKRVATSGKPVNRDTVRDAMQETKIKTLQGDIAFDANGDMISKVVSVFQYKENKAFPLDDMDHQSIYIGVAPEVPST